MCKRGVNCQRKRRPFAELIGHGIGENEGGRGKSGETEETTHKGECWGVLKGAPDCLRGGFRVSKEGGKNGQLGGMGRPDW